MRLIPSQLETQDGDTRPFGPAQLLTAADLCAVIGVTPGWVYTRTKKGAIDPLPVVRLGLRGIRLLREFWKRAQETYTDVHRSVRNVDCTAEGGS